MIYKGVNASRGMGLYDSFTGGKYKGRTLEWVLQTDRNYIVWVKKYVSSFRMADVAEARFAGSAYVNVSKPAAEVSQQLSIVARRKAYLQRR